MRINTFISKLKLLSRAKFYFHQPVKKKIVIFDHGADQLQFLKKSQCCILYIRGEKINFYILIKTIIKRGLSDLINNYIKTYLEHIKPKYIITYRCDNRKFYELKNQLPGIKTILIQWGKTIDGYFKYFKNKKNNFNVDQMYLYGDSTTKIFSNYVKGKTFSIGSIANNRYKFNHKIERNTLIFISQAKSKRIFPEIEKKILKFLKNYCLNNKLKFYVSTRVMFNDDQGKKNYEDVLGETGWHYVPRQSLNVFGDYEAYKRVFISEYVVFIDSTLGYEALSRKKKIIAFPFGCLSPNWCKKNYITNPEKNEFYIPTKFGYPSKLSAEGEFWLSYYNPIKMKEKLDFMLQIDEKKWKRLFKKIAVNEIIKFDLYNKTLIKNLKKIGVPLQKDNLSK